MINLALRRRNSREGRYSNPSQYVSPIGTFVFVVFLAAGVALTAVYNNPAGLIAGGLIGVYFLLAIKVAAQWEKVALLRLGRYKGLRGPGLFFIVPIIDQT